MASSEARSLRLRTKRCEYKVPTEFFEKKIKPKPLCLPGVFEVERIISSRGKQKNKEYLVKWIGYDMAICTWEPEENIPKPLIKALYDDPQVDEGRVAMVKVQFLTAVKGKLKSKSLDPNFTIDFEHDVYRYIFKDKGYQSNVPKAIMLEKEDFSRMQLPNSWFYCLDKNGDGSVVEFPIRAKPLLRNSTSHFILNDDRTLVPAPKYIFEVVAFYMTRNPCSKLSL